jgi:hypothetical protein
MISAVLQTAAGETAIHSSAFPTRFYAVYGFGDRGALEGW